MKAIELNATIECVAAEVIARKIIPSAFTEIPNIGKCFTYKCSLNSEATIEKELEPKEALVYQRSMLTAGDLLESDGLFVAVKCRRPYTNFGLTNHSHRHKAQTFKTREFTLAKISRMIQNIPERVLANPLIVAKNKSIER